MTTTDPGTSTIGILDLLEAPAGPPTAPPSPPTADEQRKRKRRKVIAWILAVLLVLFGALLAWYLLNRKPLTDLPGVREDRLPAYQSSIYGVDSPLGVAVSPDGSMVYATQGGPTPATFAFTREGAKVAELKPPSKPAGYHVPVYLAVEPGTGNVWVGDRGAGALYVYAPDGTYLRTFTPKDTALRFSPLGVAVAADGTVYVADVRSDKPAQHRILVFGKDGALLRTLGQGHLNYPNQLVLGERGDLFVTDSNAGRLVVFEPSGRLVSLLSHGVGEGDLGLPRGLGVDGTGRVFVVDTTDHMVRMYTAGSAPTVAPSYAGSFGDQGEADGTFMYPNGLAVDTRSRVYITDRENDRIQVWSF